MASNSSDLGRKRLWETPKLARAWERRAEQVPLFFEDEEEQPVDYNSFTADEAGVELGSMLIDLKLAGVLSAKQACIIAWRCAKAGAQGGIVEKLGFRPDAQSGRSLATSTWWQAALRTW
eukprot:4595561-Alexandrium_andersonii.AAC.1